MRGLLLDIDYSEEETQPVTKLFVKGEKETVAAIDRSFSQFFYVEAENPRKVEKLISMLEVAGNGGMIKPKSVKAVKLSRLSKEVEVLRVEARHPNDMHPLRHKIRELAGVKEIYGYDIPPMRGYLIDRQLTPMDGVEVTGEVEDENGIKTITLDSHPKKIEIEKPKLNVMSFDIEVFNPTGSPRPEKDPIMMISLADNRGLKKVLTWRNLPTDLDYVEILPTEKDTLKRFIELVDEMDVDILLGYNTDLFDFPYIKERAKQHRLKLTLGRDGTEVVTRRRKMATATRIRGRVHVDVFSMVNFLANIGNIRLIHYTLEDVYRHMMGKEKPDFEFTKFVEAWEKGGEHWNRLLEYSLSDAVATLEIGEELLPLFVELTHVVGQSLFDVSRMSAGQLVEWLLISEAYKRGELIPPRPVGDEFEERVEETFVGAYVMEPEKGYHENLVVFDFRSLYPSIIVSHNIDPSTVNCKCCKKGEATVVPELGHMICQARRGFVPEVVERVVKLRGDLKAELKKHKKGTHEYEIANARQWALKILANSFYGMLGYPRARWYSKEGAESVTSFGRHYIHETIKMAGDFGLKVCYSDTDSLHAKLNGKSREDAIKFMQEVNKNLPGIMELELEAFYPRGVFITKKRYALIDDEGRLVVKGLEFVRRDWAAIAKHTQEDVLKAILKDGSPEKAANIVLDATKMVLGGKAKLEDLIIYTQLKMPIESYRAIGPHVVAAKRLREVGHEVEPGMMIAYIEAKGAGSISDRAIPVELFKDKEYDADYYVDNQILPAVMRIMEVLGYRDADLKFEKKKQMGLDKFIG